jgi:pyruvate formate lyase activating enzyme
LLKEIEKDTLFYRESGGGVTFSGGEPLLQPDFLHESLAACKQKNLRTAVDTCGFASRDIFDKISPLVDLFLYDIKLMDSKKHRNSTGVSNRTILTNLQKLAKKHPVIIRMPFIPGVNDDENNLRLMGEYISRLDNIIEIDLLPYHRMAVSKYMRLNKPYKIEDIERPTPEQLEPAVKTLEAFGLKVKIGG